MDKVQARELIHWAESDQTDRVLITYEDPITNGRLMGFALNKSPAWLFPYLIDRYGPEIILFSPRGAAIANADIEPIIAFARALVDGEPTLVEPLPPKRRDVFNTEEQEERDLQFMQGFLDAERKLKDQPLKPIDDGFYPKIVPRPARLRTTIDHELVNLEAIKQEMPEDNRPNKERYAELIRLLSALKERPMRRLPKATKAHLRALDSLDEHFPNFNNVTEIVRRRIELQVATKGVLKLPPLLLLGPPGIGKTEYARRLAECLPMGFQGINASTTSASFVLTGGARGWGNGNAGVIAKRIIHLEDGKGLLVLVDEIEKAMSSNYPILGSLLELLERGTAEHFRDEYLNVEMNIAPMISWICTANSVDHMDTALLSRLRVVEVKPPNDQQMVAVVKSIDKAVRQSDDGLDKRFERLNEDAIKEITQVEPRRMYEVLDNAYVFCNRDKTHTPPRRGKKRVRPEHVRAAMGVSNPKQSEKPRIGFLADLPTHH